MEGVKKLNKGGIVCNYEGFVVVDKYFRRIKVKTDEYLMLHNIVSSPKRIKKYVIESVLSNRDMTAVMNINNEYIHVFKFYEYHVYQTLFSLTRLMDTVERLNEEYEGDLKLVYEHIKDHPLRKIVMHYIVTKNSRLMFFKENVTYKTLMNIIPSFVPPKY